MQFQGTKKEAKTVVSALRRELKGLNKPLDELSHADCLEILAKALGQKNWNAFEAMLADEPSAASPVAVAAPVVPMYPLKNRGQFDFGPLDPEAENVVVGPNFEGLQGTLEAVSAYSAINRICRDANGQLKEPEWSGDTKVWWDEQRTVIQDGEKTWVDKDGTEWKDSQLVMVPAAFADGFAREDEGLPVRLPLLDAYRQFFTNRCKAQDIATASSDESDWETFVGKASDVIGFLLTTREAEALRAEYAA